MFKTVVPPKLFRETAKRHTMMSGEKMQGMTQREGKRASLVREHTMADVLMTIKEDKWIQSGHIIHRIDNRWTAKVIEWQPRNYKSQKPGGEGVKTDMMGILGEVY